MSARDSDRQWQVDLTSLVAEIKTDQKALHAKLDGYISSSEKRLDKLDKIVIGNGSPGLSEEVRSLKGKWALVYGTVLLVASALVNIAVKTIFKDKVSMPSASISVSATEILK